MTITGGSLCRSSYLCQLGPRIRNITDAVHGRMAHNWSMLPLTNYALANDHIRELHAAADRRRLARLARRARARRAALARDT
jgi:hypothetical protein